MLRTFQRGKEDLGRKVSVFVRPCSVSKPSNPLIIFHTCVVFILLRTVIRTNWWAISYDICPSLARQKQCSSSCRSHPPITSCPQAAALLRSATKRWQPATIKRFVWLLVRGAEEDVGKWDLLGTGSMSRSTFVYVKPGLYLAKGYSIKDSEAKALLHRHNYHLNEAEEGKKSTFHTRPAFPIEALIESDVAASDNWPFFCALCNVLTLLEPQWW